MSDLAAFLLARLEEDFVKRVTMREWHTESCDTIPDPAGYTYPCDCGVPERMALEIDAKRRILELHASGQPWCQCGVWEETEHGEPGYEICPTLRLLALPHADRPDYDESWRP